MTHPKGQGGGTALHLLSTHCLSLGTHCPSSSTQPCMGPPEKRGGRAGGKRLRPPPASALTPRRARLGAALYRCTNPGKEEPLMGLTDGETEAVRKSNVRPRPQGS